MRRGIVIMALLCWGPQMAAAQGVTVLSGEHDGFTRLVLAIGAGRDWTMTRGDRTAHVAFDPPLAGIDLSQVYDRIEQTRLTALDRGPDGLDLSLGCDCEVTVTRYRDRYAVIDIADPPDTPPTPALPLFAGPARRPASPVQTTALAQNTPPSDPPAGAAALTNAGALLAEQMARATAAGLLDPSVNQPLTAGDPIDAAPLAAPVDPPPSPVSEPSSLPILATNAFDIANADRSGRLVMSAPGSCVAAPRRPIAEWPGDSRFLTQLGALRSRLYDDRGALDRDAALALAELYIVHGFGAEALFWLEESGAPPGFQRAMAVLVDGEDTAVFGAFADHELCDRMLLPWLFLTTDPAPRLTAETRDAILAEIFDLPVRLRDMLGPRLARHFIEAGATDAALELRAALVRGGRISAHELAFLDLALPEPGMVRPDPVDVAPANAGSTHAAPALIHRMMTQLDQTGTIPTADLVAADALIRETDPPLVLGGLRHVTALGHALEGNIAVAIPLLTQQRSRDGEEADIPAVFADIAGRLMAHDQTASLLLLLSSDVFGQFGPFPDPAFRRRVAGYLLDHGLPDLARDMILAGGSDHRRDRDLLALARDRSSQDRTPPAAIPPAPAPDVGTVPQMPDDLSALLEDSRALRAEALRILQGGSPGS